MDKDTLVKLRAEAGIQRKRLEAIEALLAAYDTPSQEANNIDNNTKYTKKRNRSAQEATKIEQACREIIRGNGGNPVSTHNLLHALRERGIVIGGQNPPSNLAARLSNSEDFESAGRGIGWILAQKNEAPLRGPQSFAGSPAESGVTAPDGVNQVGQTATHWKEGR
jgi:hypothetical protein